MLLATVGTALDDVAIGWMLGNIVGVAVEQRTRRRATFRQTGVREAWSLLGAATGLVVGLIRELS